MKHFVLKADANGTTEEIQVEQAIKDSVGNTISDTYAKKEDLYLELVFPSIEVGGFQLTLPSGTIDKIKNAKNVSICCKITDLDLTVTFNDHQYVIFSLEGQTADIISAYAVRETSESLNFHSIDIYQLSLIKLINGSEVQELAGIVEAYTQIPNIPIPFSGDDGKILSINSNRNYEIVDIESLIGDTYAKQTGTYPSMTVGNASNATNAGHAETADSATNATNATNASLATSATNVIGQIAGKNISTIFEADGTTAKEATHAASADSATKATQDGNGNPIADTYAEKSGNYPNMIVGTADIASTADKSLKDGSGNNIVDTYATKTALNNALTTKADTSGYYTGLHVGEADSAQSASSANFATQAAQATVANAATTASLGQSGVPSASDDDKIVTTEYLYPGSAGGNGVSSFSFVYRGVTHTIRMNTSYGNTTSNWMRVVRSGNTVTIGWTLAINNGIVFNKGTNYTIATGLPKAAHTENNYCVGIAPDGTVFTVYVNTSGQIILRPQTGNLVSQTVYLGCTYLTNEA